MLADAHRQAALDNEQAIADLGDPAAKPYIRRGLIELYWGAAFHWIAYGCQQKHGKHKENHTKLVSYLRDLGEQAMSDKWNRLDDVRRGGWYGHQVSEANVQAAQSYWQDIKTWANT
jgi:hypothetical protein